MRLPLRLLPALCLALAATAQYVVQRPSPLTTPMSASAGYDPVSGEAYLIAMPGIGASLQLWRFDDGVWTQMQQPAAQPPTGGATCSWPGHGLLVCGVGTWTWNGVAWTQVAAAGTTPPLLGMAFDPIRSVVTGLTSTLQTWEFDGITWLLRSTAWPPLGPPVGQAVFAFDPIQQVMTVIAGENVGGMPAFLRHQWNGTAWSPGIATSARRGFSLTSVPGHGLLLTGGFEFPFAAAAAVLWNGTQWTTPAGDIPTYRPTSLSWHDSGRNRTVVTTGLSTVGAYYSGTFGTWYWDGSTWSRPPYGNGPGSFDPGTYDSWRGQWLQFGGSEITGYEHAVLWAQGGDGFWQRLPNGPSARAHHASAFDSHRGRMVLFGGGLTPAGSTTEYLATPGTTFEWDGAAWHTFATPGATPTNHPYGRFDAAMAYDRTQRRCVLFGGRFAQPLTGSNNNDTWEWDGASWTRRQPTNVPPAVYSPRLWYDPTRNACVLYANGFYAWQGGDWVALPIPSLTGIFEAWFDPARELTLANTPTGIFELQQGVWLPSSVPAVATRGTFHLARGGSTLVDDIYWYAVVNAANPVVQPFGEGCLGTVGRPVLVAEDPFRLGSLRTLRLGAAPANAPFFGVLGDDSDQWNGQTLPIDLGTAGMPLCALRTGVVAHELVTGPGWQIQVPNQLLLLGQWVRLQAFVFDSGANALGLTTTNGLRVRIGA